MRDGKETKRKGGEETLSVHLSSPTKTRVSVVVMRSVREMKDCRKGEGVGESSIMVVWSADWWVGLDEVESAGGLGLGLHVIRSHSAARSEDIAVWGPGVRKNGEFASTSVFG